VRAEAEADGEARRTCVDDGGEGACSARRTRYSVLVTPFITAAKHLDNILSI